VSARRALVVRHVPEEDLAGFRVPIEHAGYAVETIDVGDPRFATTDLTAPDLLILMGGSMGVYERETHRWIDGEIARLATRLDADRPTLGVCLGAQMMAAALGAAVARGPAPEIGFAPISLTVAGRATPLAAIGDIPVLHWHGDSFDLPAGVELLASTDRYAHQAFRRGTNLLALQFHAEMGVHHSIETWIANAGERLPALGLDADALRADYATLGPACAAAGRAVIGAWLAMLD